METFFMNTKNSKTSEPHKFVYYLTDKLNLKRGIMFKKVITTKNLKFQHQHGTKRLIY